MLKYIEPDEVPCKEVEQDTKTYALMGPYAAINVHGPMVKDTSIPIKNTALSDFTEEIINYLRPIRFILEILRSSNGLWNNHFLLKKAE